MSEQSDELRKKALEAGLVTQQPATTPALIDDDDDPQRPSLPWVQLPVDGRLANEFNREVGGIVAPRKDDFYSSFSGHANSIYRYKDALVTVGMNEKTGRMEIEPMTAHRFRDWVEAGHLVCYRTQFNKHGAIKIKQTMGVDHAETCLRSDTFRRQQPRLLRVNEVQLPIMRKSGAIELLPIGYDEESCIITITPGWEYDETMTADQARHILEDLVKEFPFQDERSRSVFFAALISQFGYFLQWMGAKRLNYLFHANSSRSGKTLLVEIVLTVAWRWALIEPFPDKTKELRDRLDTVVREAKPFIVFDDLDREYLRSGVLNAFMTAEMWGGRKFHAQEDFSEPKPAVVLLTANNLEIAADQAGRLLICDLFVENADAQDREIDREIDAEWLRGHAVHRQLCSALWALMKHWRDGDRGHTGRVVKGYAAWCRIFGAMTMAAGFGDPCVPRENDSFGNTEFTDMQALVTRLADGVEKMEEYEFINLVQVCRELNCFPHLIKGKVVKVKEEEGAHAEFVPSDETNSALGKLFGRYGGKAFVIKGGRRAMFDKRGKNRHKRYLIQVAAVGAK